MINVLSYIGMNMQSEVCLWTLLGLIRTIFDATLFKVNANLKQVWQMSMPDELSMPVQRILRTMISGVMLVQCFTVYVYLASYIVLLYPVFLEERPALVLPWLLLAAIRKLLCELTSLALGLGTCVLLGPTRPPCIKFVIIKLISIMPAFYIWMLLFNYYHVLKMTSAFKTFPAVLPSSDPDYGLELAVRRRRTKSLLREDQLRSKLVASLYGERLPISGVTTARSKIGVSSRMIHATDTNTVDLKEDEVTEPLQPIPTISNRISETGTCEDWIGGEVIVPRDTDRILEQFVIMMLRLGAYLNKEGLETIKSCSDILNSKTSHPVLPRCDNLPCTTISADDTDTPPQVGSSRGNTASYLREYPQIFNKKSADLARNDIHSDIVTVKTRHGSEDDGNTKRILKHRVSVSSNERISIKIEKVSSRRKYAPMDKYNQQHKAGHSASNMYSRKQRINSTDLKLDCNKQSFLNQTNKSLVLGSKKITHCNPSNRIDQPDKVNSSSLGSASNISEHPSTSKKHSNHSTKETKKDKSD